MGAWSFFHISKFHCQNTNLTAPWNLCLIPSRKSEYIPSKGSFRKMSLLPFPLVGYGFVPWRIISSMFHKPGIVIHRARDVIAVIAVCCWPCCLAQVDWEFQVRKGQKRQRVEEPDASPMSATWPHFFDEIQYKYNIPSIPV